MEYLALFGSFGRWGSLRQLSIQYNSPLLCLLFLRLPMLGSEEPKSQEEVRRDLLFIQRCLCPLSHFALSLSSLSFVYSLPPIISREMLSALLWRQSSSNLSLLLSRDMILRLGVKGYALFLVILWCKILPYDPPSLDSSRIFKGRCNFRFRDDLFLGMAANAARCFKRTILYIQDEAHITSGIAWEIYRRWISEIFKLKKNHGDSERYVQ